MPSEEPGLAQARIVVRILRDVLFADLLGAYLYGSAIAGGLRPRSDVDVLAVVRKPLRDGERRAIVDRLFDISGSRARRGPARPVELTVVVASAVRPWRYPPRRDLQYGEWLRDDLETGAIPGPTADPDLATLLTMVLAHGRRLHGPEPAALLDPVPASDLRRAVAEGVPGLLLDLESDTANVLLTLARIWLTLSTGEIRSKDDAADWALSRLPAPARPALARARAVYLGESDDNWADVEPDIRAVAERVTEAIEDAAGGSSAEAG
jgi:predicted nucleotidyltransferase